MFIRNAKNFKAVSPLDIVYEDHLNGVVSFLVSGFSVFAAGGAHPRGQPVAAGGGGGGG